MHCILLAPSFQFHSVKSLDAAILRAEIGRLVAEQGSGTGAISPAGCSSQNAKLNSIVSGSHTVGVQSWVHWSHSEADNSSPCLFHLAHTLERVGQQKTLAQSVFGRNQKTRISLKHHIQLWSTKEVLETCFTTTEFTKYPSSTGLWARTESQNRDALTSIEEWGDSSTANQVLQQQALPGNENGNKGGQGIMER